MQPVKPHAFTFLFLIMLLFVRTAACYAQSATDTAFVQSAVSHAVKVYREAVGMQTHLYNGAEYVYHFKPYLEGNQFFETDAFSPGSIYYDGTWYTDVPILYDVMNDAVVTMHNSSGDKLKLINAKIDTFRLRGHTFVHFNNKQALLQPGFYDVLYSKDLKFLVRRDKSIQERAMQQGMEGEFRVEDELYICKDSTCYPVSSKRSVYAALKDRKKQLRKYASQQHLQFRKKREAAILALVKHYDDISAESAQELKTN
ncbi:hypothetical protein I2I11_18645 [Pontibacter sp. 172403-2]|nr:hypothetical protein [Pontibacter sp. 172403-2]